jgi:hypothetical protein
VARGGLASGVRIELLGFEGCPHTPEFRARLRAAGVAFTEVDITALPAGDPRRGWPAPTVLVGGSDLMGAAGPAAGGAIGCRVFPGGGLPSAEEIRARIAAIIINISASG